jgi:hypothetical protein
MPRLDRRLGLLARLSIGIAAAACVLMLCVHEAQAHKFVTSKYDYNKDVFPILRDRCGSCHVDGGAAPMSLLTYKDAVQWAESVREELVAQRMPPWYVDPSSPPIKGDRPISPREIDMLVTWASGGTPQGDLERKPAPAVFHPQWRAGLPDLEIEMDNVHVLGADVSDENFEVILTTGLRDTRWVKLVDLRPGTPSIVRDAIISSDSGSILAVWEPGSDAIPMPNGGAFRLPAGAKLHLRMHYKKQWYDEGKTQSDKSTVGVYFTEAPASGHEIEALAVDVSKISTELPGRRTLNGRLAKAARVVAIRSTVDRPYASVSVQAVTPSGRDVQLLELRAPQPAWPRRYWLQDPVDLPLGSEVTVRLTSATLDPDEAKLLHRRPLDIAVEFVPQ